MRLEAGRSVGVADRQGDGRRGSGGRGQAAQGVEGQGNCKTDGELAPKRRVTGRAEERETVTVSRRGGRGARRGGKVGEGAEGRGGGLRGCDWN